MNQFSKVFIGLLISCSLASAATAAVTRVVSLGGTVTEIIYDLGREHLIVANDLSSIYPKKAQKTPKIGYYRSLPLEGILSVQPDLILASENAGPERVLNKIRDLGVNVKTVSDQPKLESLYKRIEQISESLSVTKAGSDLIKRIQTNIDQAQQLPVISRKTLLLMNRTGQFMAAGSATAANEILQLAGLDNALAEQNGYKNISAESIAAITPEMIVITRESLGDGGLQQLLDKPGIASSPAAINNRIVVIDDLLILGLGPRVDKAIRILKKASL